MTGEPEFSRVVDLRGITDQAVALSATEAECMALAERFGLVSIRRLGATVSMRVEGPDVLAEGRLDADIIQACAVSAEDLAVHVDVPIQLRFVPPGAADPGEDEIEIDSAALDEIEYVDGRFDLGEAIAQTLALSIDPFAVGPEAEAARAAAGISDTAANGPFAALAALKKPG